MKLEFFSSDSGLTAEKVNVKIENKWIAYSNVSDNIIELLFRRLLENKSTAIAIRKIAEAFELSKHNDILRVFIQCNWAQLNEPLDIDNDTFNFEKVSCKQRSTCKLNGIICIKC